MDHVRRSAKGMDELAVVEAGLGVPCAQAQADGVPCTELGIDCAECARAQASTRPAPPPATLEDPTA
jgi:hypothetical protein